jgi:hypothetical protein
MAVVLGEVTKSFVWIKEDVLMPTIRDAFDMDGSPLKTNCLIGGTANRAPRAQRNKRRIFIHGGLELLQNCQPRILGIKD